MTGAANSEEDKNDAVGVKPVKRAKTKPKPKPKAVDSKGTHRRGTSKRVSKTRDPIKGTHPMAEDARVYNSAAVLPKGSKANLNLVDSGGGSSSHPRSPPSTKPHTLEWKVSPPPPPFSLTVPLSQMPPSNYVVSPVVQYSYGVPAFAPPEYGNKNVAFVGSQENIQGGPTIRSEEAEPNLTTADYGLDINDEGKLFLESLEYDENFQSFWNSVGPTEPQAATAVESSDPAAGNNNTTSAGMWALEDFPPTGVWDF